MAGKVHAALGTLSYRSDVSLAARYREPLVAWRRPSAAERTSAERTLAKGPQGTQDLSYIYAQRTMSMVELPENTPIPLQVLRVGPVCIGTMPCEVFCEIGLEFKRRSARQPAFMVSLNHGYFGYLPTPRHLDLGGYETWLGTDRVGKTPRHAA